MAVLTAARPAGGALLRYSRDMERAYEAFCDACLRALKNWLEKGPPPASRRLKLILSERNAALDGVRKNVRATRPCFC